MAKIMGQGVNVDRMSNRVDIDSKQSSNQMITTAQSTCSQSDDADYYTASGEALGSALRSAPESAPENAPGSASRMFGFGFKAFTMLSRGNKGRVTTKTLAVPESTSLAAHSMRVGVAGSLVARPRVARPWGATPWGATPWGNTEGMLDDVMLLARLY